MSSMGPHLPVHASSDYDDSRSGARLPCGVVVPTFEEMRQGRIDGNAVSHSLRFITCPRCRAWAVEQRWPAEPGEKQMGLRWGDETEANGQREMGI